MLPQENKPQTNYTATEMVAMILAKKLKELLRQRDITVAQLARATKISPKTIYTWLSGAKPRDLNQVNKVAGYFEVSIDYLAFGKVLKNKEVFDIYKSEINAGIFEVILRKAKK